MLNESLISFAKSFHAILIDPNAVEERDAAGYGAAPLSPHQSAIMQVFIEVQRRKNTNAALLVE